MREAEIIICAEKGYLECQAKLLVSTLRNLGGAFKDTPIYCYAPRKGYGVSNSSRDFFEKHQVVYVDLVLNKDFSHYPISNKIFACAHRERNSSSNSLVFLDSDIFFLNEPSEFLLPDGVDVVLRPVDGKGLGVTKEEFAKSEYWKGLYDLLETKEREFINYTGGDERILEYYNSGQIISKRNTCLFENWEFNFQEFMKTSLPDRRNLFFTDQTVLAASIVQLDLKVKLLEWKSNYPLQLGLDGNIRNEKYKVPYFDCITTVHYHKIFKNKKYVPLVVNTLDKSENGKIVNKLIKEHGLIQQESIYHWVISKLFEKIYSLRLIFKYGI